MDHGPRISLLVAFICGLFVMGLFQYYMERSGEFQSQGFIKVGRYPTPKNCEEFILMKKTTKNVSQNGPENLGEVKI